MYPGVALFYPQLARALLKYRVGTMEGAKYNAQKQGYKVSWSVWRCISTAEHPGAVSQNISDGLSAETTHSSTMLFTLRLFLQGLKFPWESAVSGREVCPDDVYGQQEIHINGDVTLAFQNYLYLTEVRWFFALVPSGPSGTY